MTHSGEPQAVSREEVTAAVAVAWDAHPDYRLGQLLCIAATGGMGRLVDATDAALLAGLREFAGRGRLPNGGPGLPPNRLGLVRRLGLAAASSPDRTFAAVVTACSLAGGSDRPSGTINIEDDDLSRGVDLVLEGPSAAEPAAAAGRNDGYPADESQHPGR